MKNYKKLIVGGVIFLIVIAAIATVAGISGLRNNAGNESSSLSLKSLPAARSGESLAVGDTVSQNTDTDQKIIKNGSLNVKVDSTDSASEKISQIAKDNGGEIFSSNFYQSSKDIKSGIISVKVPVANFEKTLAEIKKVAALVVRESMSGQDVTEEYADLRIQFKNKQAEEQQYLEILKQAQKVSDILEVTQQLSRVRGEIEQLQGRIKFLNSQTEMSLITVNMTEDANITISDSWRPWQVVKSAVNALIKKGQGFINLVIVLVIMVIPVVILYLLLIWLVYFIGKKIYSKIKNSKK